MGKRPLIESEDEDEGDDPESSSPQAKRTRSVRKPSRRQAEIDKENEETEQNKLIRLQKEIARLKKKNKKIAEANANAHPETQARNDRNSDIESEDEPDDEIAFSSSIKPLATTSNTQQKTPKAPRRAKSCSSAPKAISSRAFLTVPAGGEEPVASSSLSIQSSPTPVIDTNMTPPVNIAPAVNTNNTVPTPDAVPSVDTNTAPAVDAGTVPTNNNAGAAAASTASSPVLAGADLKAPQFAEGYRAGSKAKAGDYEPVVCALLLRTMREYEAMVSTKDGFPDPLVRGEWAKMCWQRACNQFNERYQLTARMSSLIGKRGSRVRSEVLSIVRNQVASFYGFNLNTTPKATDHNRTLAAKLLSGSAFHHKDPDAKTGYGQSRLISDLIHLAWFDSGEQSAGIVYSSLFNPISLETLALLFTLIEFCLKEWSSGQRTPATFFEKTIKAAHEVHRVDLKKWNDLNVQVIRNIRTKLYIRAKRNSGVVDANAPVARLTGEAEDRARDELAGRTGETDSEASDGE